MKTRHLIISAATLCMLVACGGNNEQPQQTLEEVSKQELAQALAERDSLLALVGDVAIGLEQIKQLENIMTVAVAHPETAGKQRAQIMADIASLNLPEPYIKEEHVKLFESTIDKFDALLQPLGHFLIPGDTVAAAALDIARTTTRRAERCLLRLAETEEVNPNVLICLNRLSDLCFILARVESEVK